MGDVCLLLSTNKFNILGSFVAMETLLCRLSKHRLLTDFSWNHQDKNDNDEDHDDDDAWSMSLLITDVEGICHI